jgi:hypothetical protein
MAKIKLFKIDVNISFIEIFSPHEIAWYSAELCLFKPPSSAKSRGYIFKENIPRIFSCKLNSVEIFWGLKTFN